MFNYTPRGDNHAKDFHKFAKANQRWFSSLLTVDDTHVIPPAELGNIRDEYIQRRGNDALFQQEWYCSFDTPVEGAYYGQQIQQAFSDGRVASFPYDPTKLVFTSWDFGAGKTDTTAITFYQKDGKMVNNIDFYEVHQAGMGKLAQILQGKGYSYDTHYLPHDANAKVQGEGESSKTRKEMLEEMLPNQRFVIIPRAANVMAEIEITRTYIGRCRFDEVKCERLIKALKEYHQDYDETTKSWGKEPKHDWSSHPADAFREQAVSYRGEDKYDDPNRNRDIGGSW
jgi:hypothetical protein